MSDHVNDKRKARSIVPGASTGAAAGLPVLRGEVAGIDVGSTQHWVSSPPKPDGTPNVGRFGTTTVEMEKIAGWLAAEGVKSVAMESTGVYWIPLYELLESRGIGVVLVNARQLKHVPGRKSDMLDCQWLQTLHACGLLRGSFRPEERICALRSLMRECANLIEERTRAVQRMQKALDQMNVQVHRAVSDITGTTGMGIIRAIVAGERDPLALAGLRDKRCQKSPAQFAEHLRGTWREEHLFNLAMHLDLYDKLGQMIEAYRLKIAKLMEALGSPDRRDQQPPQHPNPTKAKAIERAGDQPLRQTLWRMSGVDLTRIDGINVGVAGVALTEIGPELSAFPTEHHFTSWMRLAPNRSVSGGKVLKKKRNAAGATRLANALRQAACSLQRSDTALGGQFRRLARRKGYSVAVFAMARKLAVLIYRMLRYGQDYIDEGLAAYEERFKQRRLQNIRNTARQMGYQITPIPLAA
jgi:transposase